MIPLGFTPFLFISSQSLLCEFYTIQLFHFHLLTDYFYTTNFK
nr:MAG TPA: hypothetical protein [Caudoviricetes sp.]